MVSSDGSRKISGLGLTGTWKDVLKCANHANWVGSDACSTNKPRDCRSSEIVADLLQNVVLVLAITPYCIHTVVAIESSGLLLSNVKWTTGARWMHARKTVMNGESISFTDCTLQ